MTRREKSKEMTMHCTIRSVSLSGFIAAIVLGAVSMSPAKAADDTSILLMAQNCGVCHGFEGREFDESMPPLAGMSDANFVTAMKRFRDGGRPAIVMDRVAKALSDEQIEGLAQYYAAIPPVQYGSEE